MSFESVVMLVVSAGLMVYLLYALVASGEILNDRKWMVSDHSVLLG